MRFNKKINRFFLTTTLVSSPAFNPTSRSASALIKILLMIASLLWVQSAFALKSDRTSPILIEANQVDMADKTGVSTYTGDVELQQGSIRIAADSIVVFTKNKKLQRIIANGLPAKFSQQPDENSQAIVASANQVEYSSNSGMLILLENASMQQGTNSFSSNRIEYDTLNDILSARSTPNNKQRVKAIIQPDTFDRPEKTK